MEFLRSRDQRCSQILAQGQKNDRAGEHTQAMNHDAAQPAAQAMIAGRTTVKITENLKKYHKPHGLQCKEASEEIKARHAASDNLCVHGCHHTAALGNGQGKIL